MVVVAQRVVGEVVHHVHRTDGQAVLVLRAFVDDGRGLFHQSLHGHAGAPCAPLLVDDAALLVDFIVFQQQVVAPVVQDEQTGVHHAGLVHRCGRDVVDRLVNAGVGVQVRSELDAHALAPFAQARLSLRTGEILRAVERHVLQEVGQSALARLLQNASHALSDVELGHVGRLVVVADVVGKSVGQPSFADALVLRQWLRGCQQRHDGQSQQECCQCFPHRMNLLFVDLMSAKLRKKTETTLSQTPSLRKVLIIRYMQTIVSRLLIPYNGDGLLSCLFPSARVRLSPFCRTAHLCLPEDCVSVAFRLCKFCKLSEIAEQNQ